jgi:hypothetical protein
MGTTTNAVLFYGFVEQEEGDWSDAVDRHEEWDYTELRDLEKRLDVELDSHCSHDYPMWYIAVESKTVTARRGDVKEITSATLEIDPTWDAKLREYAAAFEIDLGDQVPGWCLVSYWG